MPDHPLKVYYPFAGPHYILLWKTHNEGQNVIVSKTFSGLLSVWNSIVKKYFTTGYDCAQLLSAIKINLVAPPEKLCQEAKIRKHKINAENFHKNVIFELSDLLFDYKNVSGWQDEFPIASNLFSFCQGHSDGKNCICLHTGIKISSSKEEFYDWFHLIWKEKFEPIRKALQPNIKTSDIFYEIDSYSRAPIAKENETLFCAIPQFGHHEKGVILKSVSDVELSDSVLFFYQNTQDLSKEEQELLQKLLEIEKKTHEKISIIEEKNKKAMRDLKEKVKQLEISALQEIFK